MYYPEYSKVQYESEKVDISNSKKKTKSLKNESPEANQCKICGLVNFNAWSLTIHMRRHNNNKPSKCSYCPASFVNNTELKTHIATHTKEKKYKCRFCPKWFMNNSCKYVHEDTHGILEHKCKYCDAKFRTQVNRRIHQRTHGREALTCRFCIKKFANENFLRLHEQTDHVKALNCTKCKLKFQNNEELQAHKMIHKKTHKIFMGKKSNEVSYFQDSDVKLSTYFFTCGICLNKFSFRLDLTKHIESVHPMHEKDNVYKFKCTVCNKCFDSKIKLRGHMIGHGPKNHKCPHCEYRSTRGKDLAKHVQSKHSSGKNYKCSQCGLLFVHFSTFVCHKLKHGEKRFKCDMCDKAYYVKSRLSNHKRVSHYSGNPVCDQCGKVFRNIQTLRAHQRSFHNRPISLCLCNHCGKTIYVNEVLSHQKECSIANYKDVVTKLKGPLCSLCNITFSIQRDLLEHFKELHPSSIYSCEFCHKQYLSHEIMQRHMERKHMPDKPLLRKRMHIFSTEEKRLLKENKSLIQSNNVYECFACGNSYKNQVTMDNHLEQSSCLQTKFESGQKKSQECEQYFGLTKIYHSNGHAQVLNDFEVQIIPKVLKSEPLNIKTTLSSEFIINNKQIKCEPITKKKPKRTFWSPIESINLPKEETSLQTPSQSSLLSGMSLYHTGSTAMKESSKVSHIQLASPQKTNQPGSIVSSKDLLKLLQHKTVNMDGTPFIPFNELFEHLKLISGIELSNTSM